MLTSDRGARGVAVRGVMPEAEDKVADFGQHMVSGTLEALQPGAFGIVLGADLARSLGVMPGDKLALIAPQGVPDGRPGLGRAPEAAGSLGCCFNRRVRSATRIRQLAELGSTQSACEGYANRS
jgi:hypothetical protein